MDEPLVLAFDTSAAHCAAALLCGEDVVTARSEEMGRGQAERLMPMLEEILSEAGKGWPDLAAIGVGTGPGNFTGIRISVAAARGLALGLGIPAIGVTGFDAAALAAPRPLWIAIEAPRAQVYLQRFGDAGANAPALRPVEETGSLDAPVFWLSDLPATELVVNIARIARDRRGDALPRPAPLYLRPADAAPMRDAPPIILP